MTSALTSIIGIYSYLLLGAVLLFNLLLLLLLIISPKRWLEHVREVNTDPYMAVDYSLAVSLLVPVYNAQESIIAAVESLLAVVYPNYEIIIINDGSTDRTLETVIEHYQLKPTETSYAEEIPTEAIGGMYTSLLHPNLLLLDKIHGGQADALNAGINAARYPLFCNVDADSTVEPYSLLRLAAPFMKDERTVAVEGAVRIQTGLMEDDESSEKSSLPRKSILIFQIIEYLRSFSTYRIAWEKANALVITSPVFSVFLKQAVKEIGGYKRQGGDNTELSLHLHSYLRQQRLPYRIDFAPEAQCWIKAPESLKSLRSQRIRQHQRLLSSLWKHKNMLCNPRYGTAGLLAMPYLWLTEGLGPLFEGLGYLLLITAIATGTMPLFMGLIFALAVLYIMFFSILAVAMEEWSYRRYRKGAQLVRLLLMTILEPLIFRPMTVFWKIRALIGRRQDRYARSENRLE